MTSLPEDKSKCHGTYFHVSVACSPGPLSSPPPPGPSPPPTPASRADLLCLCGGSLLPLVLCRSSWKGTLPSPRPTRMSWLPYDVPEADPEIGALLGHGMGLEKWDLRETEAQGEA